MGPTVQGIGIGVLATVGMDCWAAIAKHVLGLPTANWAMVGRWFGHMPRGALVHASIADAPPIRNELALGWISHYLIGVLYGLAYLYLVQIALSGVPSLVSALGFGLVTLFAPWLIMQPAMGLGVCASRTPKPAVLRLVNLSMHSVFGVSLYLAWLLIQ
jgi:hypothetical protein